MTKRVLSAILSVCLLFGVFSCFASAAAIPTIDSEIPVKVRICPGRVIDIDAPEVNGNVYAQGWEIKVVGGDWIPYDGEPLDRFDDGAYIRYFAANSVGGYAYSNEALLIIDHNPIGDYKYSGTDHWRDCADCDGKADKGAHTTLGADATAGDNICKVCGHRRTSQYTGLLAFFEWVMALIGSLLG
ncbi:MAG: hypothetical protein J6A49_05010 [Clostridia bacterium]|nr:hypothetical protein [Clostridia bacterium]